MDIVDSSQHSLDSSVLTPYQVPESSSEASMVSYEGTHGTSGVTLPSSNQTGYTSCSQVQESTSQMHEVLKFRDSSTDVTGCAVPLAQSMPLLLETGPWSAATKRHLDGEGIDNTNDLDHSKRVKTDESERMKDQVTPSCSLPTPDSLSLQSDDKMCIEDDYELPPPFPQPTGDKKVFSRNDIVWMKVKKIYVPGVVIYTRRKKRLAYVRGINRPIHEKSFRKHFRDLLDFCNKDRNRQLLEEGRKHDVSVQAAFDKIAEFYYKNIKAEGTLSAVKYLSCNKNDAFRGWSGISELWKMHAERNQQHRCNDTNAELASTDGEHRDKSDTSDDDSSSSDIFRDVSSTQSSNRNEQDKVILRQQMEEESKLLFTVIKSPECKKHLQKIFNETVESRRHSLFMTKIYTTQKDLRMEAGFGPFSSHKGVEVAQCLDKYLHEIDRSNTVAMSGLRNDYLFYVLVPEAIIFSLCKVHELNYENGEQRFKDINAKAIY